MTKNQRFTSMFILFLLPISLFGQKGYETCKVYMKDRTVVEGTGKFFVGSWSVWGSKPSVLKFKTTEDEKPIKYKTDDLRGFVIGEDSFAIVKNVQVTEMAPTFYSDFARVIKKGALNLYEHKCASTNQYFRTVHQTWVVQKNRSTRFISLHKPKKQKEVFLDLISTNEELTERLSNTSPKKWDFPTIVEEYNADD